MRCQRLRGIRTKGKFAQIAAKRHPVQVLRQIIGFKTSKALHLARINKNHLHPVFSRTKARIKGHAFRPGGQISLGQAALHHVAEIIPGLPANLVQIFGIDQDNGFFCLQYFFHSCKLSAKISIFNRHLQTFVSPNRRTGLRNRSRQPEGREAGNKDNHLSVSQIHHNSQRPLSRG